jgi:hypothetical protein
MSDSSEPKVYQLKISIAGLKPVIWRRVQVLGNITLGDLHYVIQAAMGWYDSHLHCFEVPGPGHTVLKTRRARTEAIRYESLTDPAGGLMDWLDEEEINDETKAILEEVVPAEKMHFMYTYDMGDNWDHDIVVEKILPADPEGVYPICLAGALNGPVEDCGGIWGYAELLDILADPKHPQYRDMKTWLKEVFGVSKWDGDAFDLEAINKRMKKLQPRKKGRSK